MVDDAPVTTGLRSRRAIDTLAAYDPQFIELLTTLYGEVDLDEVWTETFGKMNPDSSSMHVPGTAQSPGGSKGAKWALRLGLLGTAAGALTAGGDIGEGLHGLATAKDVKPIGGRLVPKKLASKMAGAPRRTAAARTALGTTAIGADAVAARAVRHEQQKVNKGLGGASVEDLAKGILVQSRRVVGDVLGNAGGAARAADTSVDAARIKSSAPRAGKAQAKHAQAKPASNQLSMLDNNLQPVAGSVTAGQLGTQAIGAKAGGVANAVAGTPQRAAVTAGVGASAYAASKVGSNKSQAGYYTQPAYYSKRDDVEWEGTFSKLDDDKHLAFGWANVCKLNGQLVTDRQGDIIVPEELEDAAYEFVLSSRAGGDMHLRTDGYDVYPQEKARPGDTVVPVAQIVESMMFTEEKKLALGLPENFPEGWWIGMKYHDEDVWADIKANRRSGFSIHGNGVREPVDAFGKAHDAEKTLGVSAVVLANRRSLGRGLGKLVRRVPGGQTLHDDFGQARHSTRAAAREARTALMASRNVASDLRISSRPRGPLAPTIVHGPGTALPDYPIRRRAAVTAGGGALYVHADRRS